MAKTIPLRNAFMNRFESHLLTLGFGAGKRKPDEVLVYPAPVGSIDLTAQTIHRTESIDMCFYCGVTVDTVEKVLVSSGFRLQNFLQLPSTASTMLGNILFDLGYKIESEHPRIKSLPERERISAKVCEFGTADGSISIYDSEQRINFVVDRSFRRFQRTAWPILQEISQSEERFLSFTLREDRLASSFFAGSQEVQYLSGLILAQKRKDSNASNALISAAEAKFARYEQLGNPVTMKRFKEWGKKLDLL